MDAERVTRLAIYGTVRGYNSYTGGVDLGKAFARASAKERDREAILRVASTVCLSRYAQKKYDRLPYAIGFVTGYASIVNEDKTKYPIDTSLAIEELYGLGYIEGMFAQLATKKI